MKMKKDWSSKEDKICSLVFIKNHVNNNIIMSISIEEAKFFGVDKSEESIRRKFSNIAAICDVLHIKVLSEVGILMHFSEQNLIEFLKVKDLTNIEVLEELHRISKDYEG